MKWNHNIKIIDMIAVNTGFLQGKKNEYWDLLKDKGKRNISADWNRLLTDKDFHFVKSSFPYSMETIIKMEFPDLVKLYIEYINVFLPNFDSYKRVHPRKGKKLQKALNSIFDYDKREYLIKGFFKKYAKDIHIHSCHYCDIIPIYSYEEGKSICNQFHLDHILDKGNCPLISYSLMNFVPSCSTCNSNIKKTKIIGASYDSKGNILAYNESDMIMLSPTHKTYDFDKNVLIGIEPANSSGGNFADCKDKYHIVFSTCVGGNPKYLELVDFFKLNGRYNAEDIKDRALVLADKCHKYPLVVRKENAQRAGIDLSKYEEDLFGYENYKYSLSKLYHDILAVHKD